MWSAECISSHGSITNLPQYLKQLFLPLLLRTGLVFVGTYVRTYVCMYVCMDGWMDGVHNVRSASIYSVQKKLQLAATVSLEPDLSVIHRTWPVFKTSIGGHRPTFGAHCSGNLYTRRRVVVQKKRSIDI